MQNKNNINQNKKHPFAFHLCRSLDLPSDVVRLIWLAGRLFDALTLALGVENEGFQEQNIDENRKIMISRTKNS